MFGYWSTSKSVSFRFPQCEIQIDSLIYNPNEDVYLCLILCVSLVFRTRELVVWGFSISKGTSLQEMESRCRRSMGDMERREKMLWAWLADFLSRTLQGIVCFLSVCLSQSVFLPASQQQDGQDGEGGWRWRQMTEKERLRAAASEGTGKINF